TAASRYAESSAQSGRSRGYRIDGESRAKRFAGESQQLYRTCRAQPDRSVGLQVTVLERDLAVLQLVEIDAVAVEWFSMGVDAGDAEGAEQLVSRAMNACFR